MPSTETKPQRKLKSQERRIEDGWTRITTLVTFLTTPRYDTDGNPVWPTLNEAVIHTYGEDSINSSRSLGSYNLRAGRRWKATAHLRDFISYVSEPQNHSEEDVERARQLMTVVEANLGREIQPSALYNLLRIEPKKDDPSVAVDGMQSRSVLPIPEGSSLPQPETDPSRRKIHMPTFLDHLQDTQPGEGTTIYIGERTPPTPRTIDSSPLRDYGTDVRLHDSRG